MKNVLFVYPQMMIGGSTTTLLSMLNNFDYEKYNIDLLLLYEGGPLFDKIPKQVNILPFAHKYQNKRERIIHRLLSPKYMVAYIGSKVVYKKTNNILVAQQYIGSKNVEFYKKLDKHYDVAVGFLEGPADRYVANYVSASLKIGWFHLDFLNNGYVEKYDREYISKLDICVTVSDECVKSFAKYSPKSASKLVMIDTVIFKNTIIKDASEIISDLPNINNRKVNFISVCRIDFSHKGLDRIINLYNKHKEESMWDNFSWYIIGDGPDYVKLKELIEISDMKDKIFLLGSKLNPLPYEKHMDMFLLPSYYEGKPRAVTEAMLVGLPPLVTRYVSAYEQIENGVDGIIAENNDEDLYLKLKNILSDREKIRQLKLNVMSRDYSTYDEMKRIEDLLDGNLVL